MSRALVVAPLARDLSAIPNTVRIPGAANATKQAWDTLERERIEALNDATLVLYATFQSIPLALKKLLVRVRRYDTAACLPTVTTVPGPDGIPMPTPDWKRLADCGSGDFLKVKSNGVPATKAATALVAGDRPQEWSPIHRWAGNPGDTLGDA